MLNYIVFYDSKMSTNDKLNDYILKVLRGIQKIRRIIFPMQSNEKLDPFGVLENIENWVEKKVKEKGRGDFVEKYTKSRTNLRDKEEEHKFLDS